MITELRLENWKSYEKASLHIDPLSVLVGTNASGKSNALDALLFLHRVAFRIALANEDAVEHAGDVGIENRFALAESKAADRTGGVFADALE